MNKHQRAWEESVRRFLESGVPPQDQGCRIVNMPGCYGGDMVEGLWEAVPQHAALAESLGAELALLTWTAHHGGFVLCRLQPRNPTFESYILAAQAQPSPASALGYLQACSSRGGPFPVHIPEGWTNRKLFDAVQAYLLRHQGASIGFPPSTDRTQDAFRRLANVGWENP